MLTSCDATCWTAVGAVGTWALVVVSAGLLIPTLIAARSAAYSVALESEPVILIEPYVPVMPLSNISAWYEFSFSTDPEKHNPLFTPFTPSAGYNFTDREVMYPDGRKNIYTNLRVRNLGRSPTIDLALPLKVSWLDVEFGPADDDAGFGARTVGSSSNVTINVRAIGPQSDAIIAIINKTGKQFRIESTGVASDVSPKGKRRKLAAFSPQPVTIAESV